jgi:hypothetical protein
MMDKTESNYIFSKFYIHSQNYALNILVLCFTVTIRLLTQYHIPSVVFVRYFDSC